MATTFSVTRDDIINRALRIVGAYDPTNPPSSIDYSICSLALNMMIKAWIVDGVAMWKVETINLPLLTGVNTYQIGPYATGTGALVTNKILKVLLAVVRNNTNPTAPFDTPIDQLSIQEYEQYGAKASLGVVNSMLYRPVDDSTGNSSYIEVYPTPADSFHSLRMQCYVTIDDVTTGTDPLDFPQECYLALSWNLAAEVGMEYAVSSDRMDRIAAKALSSFNTMKDWSQENSDSVRFLYDTRSMG